MKTVAIELVPPVDRLVEHWVKDEQISSEQAVQELIALGFEARLRDLYARYRRAECSLWVSGGSAWVDHLGANSPVGGTRLDNP